jgi:uncharacterized protein (TIGR02246 family)
VERIKGVDRREFANIRFKVLHEATIRGLYQQTIDGWDVGNGDAFAAPYADDSDFIGFDGTYMKGRQEIASFHQMLFDKFL